MIYCEALCVIFEDLVFYVSDDAGFEAFFTENMNFVVATRTKKEFNAYIVYQAMFRSSEWVC